MTEEARNKNCPECGRPMALRTAKRGVRMGQQFWGCTGYPSCRFAVDIDDDAVTQETQRSETGPECPTCGRVTVRRVARQGKYAGRPFWSCPDRTCKGLIDIPSQRSEVVAAAEGAATRLPLRVPFFDATTFRRGWAARYTAAGASLRALRSPRAEWAELRHVWIARTDNGASPEPEAAHAAALLRRVVQRGDAPPLHPGSEDIVLKEAGLADAIEPPLLPGDLSFRLREGAATDNGGHTSQGLNHPVPDLDSNLPLDSDEERVFLTQWLPSVSAEAARWASPQASLDSLAKGFGVSTSGTRRVDFLLSSEWGRGRFVVEIDGDQHVDSVAVDEGRDETLKRAGFDVLRVPVAEVLRGSGAHLSQVAKRLRDENGVARMPVDPQSTIGYGPAEVHRAVLALAEALATGLICGSSWSIRLVGCSEWLAEAMVPYLDLLLGFDRIWSLSVAPETLSIWNGERSLVLHRDTDGYARSELDTAPPPTLAIVLDPLRGPCEALPMQEISQVVVRSADVPVELERQTEGLAMARLPTTDLNDLHWGLKQVLHAVFAKEEFLEGQLEAITQVISGLDCAVLLPTGAGKSLIYQLAGFCLPGRTLVIDPLISLMEDQVSSLHKHGIDRVVDISGYTRQQGYLDDQLRQFGSGDALFSFVAPERLQTRQFRDAARKLSHTNTPITLAVVDEAHCVSEWGHDFRTAYLNIGKVVRDICRGTTGQPPVLLALTGTASRAVLKDVLFELEIDSASQSAVVRPKHFDRPELNYQIVRVQPKDAGASLAGLIQSLPAQFNVSTTEFFSPRRERTFSGLMFCPHVNGSYGVVEVAKEIETLIPGRVGTYSGSTKPRGVQDREWEAAKRDNANLFKANELPLLVSTKAFGMGIDKPNVRYVVHLGIPSSIEGYYQEVGRAGRDKQQARCILLLTEYDEQRNRQLLAEDASLEDARQAAQSVKRTERDDVTNQLYFHFNSFRGITNEMADVKRLLDEIDQLGQMRELQLPFWNEGNSDENANDGRQVQERALHRLVLLGAVRDYQLEWGSRSFTLSLANADSRTIVRHLIDYIDRSQPARAEAARQAAAPYEDAELTDATLGCARLLIEFVYEFVEGSRRRSLREMWLATKESIEDPNQELRDRVLRYLSEGDIAPALERLAEARVFSYAPWLDELAQIMLPDEARELRGNAARLLASYPDHPGLLLARGLAELIDPHGDLQELVLNIRASLYSAREHYSATADELALLGGWLTHKCNGMREGSLTSVVVALKEDGANAPIVNGCLRRALTAESAEPGLRVLALAAALEDAVQELGNATGVLEGMST